MIRNTPQFGRITISQSTPFWLYWAELAIRHERLANRSRRSFDQGRNGRALVAETQASMLTISCSAHAIEAFYGRIRKLAVSPKLLQTWNAKRELGKRAKRSNQILEAIKQGLSVDVGAWRTEFSWLFDLRDAAVHYEEKSKEVVEHPSGSYVAPEHLTYSAESASRAVDLMLDVFDKCTMSKPKMQQLADSCHAIRHQVDDLVARRAAHTRET